MVDDEQTARYVLRRYLASIGCRVIEAAGGEEALFRAAAEQPDVIFLDLRMPDMLGTEVLGAPQARARYGGHPRHHRDVADRDRQRATAALDTRRGVSEQGTHRRNRR